MIPMISVVLKCHAKKQVFIRPMKNFVRSVWDLMSLISPPSPLNPKNPPTTPPPPLCSRTEISKNTLNWQQKARNETTTTTKAKKDQKLT